MRGYPQENLGADPLPGALGRGFTSSTGNAKEVHDDINTVLKHEGIVLEVPGRELGGRARGMDYL